MDVPRRKNIRLAHYDYGRSGGYYITICTHEKRQILSRIIIDSEYERARIVLTELGRIICETMEELTPKYGFRLDASVIMPNHIHFLVFKESEENDKTVGVLIGAIKSVATNRWCKVCDKKNMHAGKLWQRNYYDHILRNEADYMEKLRYIQENPDAWAQDDLYTPE